MPLDKDQFYELTGMMTASYSRYQQAVSENAKFYNGERSFRVWRNEPRPDHWLIGMGDIAVASSHDHEQAVRLATLLQLAQ